MWVKYIAKNVIAIFKNNTCQHKYSIAKTSLVYPNSLENYAGVITFSHHKSACCNLIYCPATQHILHHVKVNLFMYGFLFCKCWVLLSMAYMVAFIHIWIDTSILTSISRKHHNKSIDIHILICGQRHVDGDHELPIPITSPCNHLIIVFTSQWLHVNNAWYHSVGMLEK